MMLGAESKSVTSSLRSTPGRVSVVESIFGAISVLSFVTIWVLSAASPAVFGLAVFWGFRKVSASMLAVLVVAYLPWKRGPISTFVQGFIDRYHPAYYDGVCVEFEDGAESTPTVPASTTQASQRLQLELEQTQTFFAVHPHGAFCIGWAVLFTSHALRRVRFCFAPSLLASPFFRLFSRSVGNPGSASRQSMDAYMKAGQHVALPPGGFEEATLTSTKQDRVFINKRYGFVRLCLKHGVAIRPVYCFGEGELFSNLQGMWAMRLALNRKGIPTILPWGTAFFPLLPKKGVHIHIVIGRPLLLPRIENPTKDQVQLWHKKYINELRRVYEDHKEDAYGPEKAKVSKLEVW